MHLEIEIFIMCRAHLSKPTHREENQCKRFSIPQYSHVTNIIIIIVVVIIIGGGVQTFMAGHNPSVPGERKADVRLCAGVHVCVAEICFLTLRS